MVHVVSLALSLLVELVAAPKIEEVWVLAPVNGLLPQPGTLLLGSCTLQFLDLCLLLPVE